MGKRDFGWVLDRLWEGEKLYREGWNGRNMFIQLQRTDAGSKMTQPYIYLEIGENTNPKAYPHGYRVPWVASQTDLLAEDWMIYD